MKKLIVRFALLGLLLLPVAAQAQPYSIDWYKIAGGGGASTGGVYTITGTIGQADAGTLSGGNFTLQGGFWGAVIAIQTPGAPLLSIIRVGDSVVVSWRDLAGAYLLEQTPSLSGTPLHWTSVPASQYQTNASQISLTLSPPIGNQCYRLRKQ